MAAVESVTGQSITVPTRALPDGSIPPPLPTISHQSVQVSRECLVPVFLLRTFRCASFKIAKGMHNLMFQADMFNIFNRANFVWVAWQRHLTAGSGNFGAVGAP